ncbi:MAG TPA: VIT1/CCC1 transporter family protein [Myxococcales bacterium]|jgi:VIT1/CCC1 family predicted Fe2+/Mn2+ transporter|nr:VIT1/CCC1 transporter family protein [Myxococcales bacterium]
MPLRLPGFFLRTRDDGATHSEAAHIPGGRSVRDLVFGANDGLVAAFAVVSGVHGADVSTHITLLAGIAELLGGTIAMGLGAFLAAKSEREYVLSEREREEYEVEHFPQEERREVRSIFETKGYRGKALDTIVEHVTADPKFWVDTMMTEELGLSVAPTTAPLRSGLVVALAYAVGAAFPVLPYAWPIHVDRAFVLSIVLTLTALFGVGAAKTKMTGRPWLRSGFESVLVGALAAAATFFAGRLVSGGLQ